MVTSEDSPAASVLGELSGERVEAALESSLKRLRTRCHGIADETYDLITVAARLGLAEGKRLRAHLFYWGWRAAGCSDCDEVIDVAIALEVFHLFALVHDDLMDQSALRRGLPSAHLQLSRTHESCGWRGDSDHFGLSSAMLLGDALLVWADTIIDGSSLFGDRMIAFRRAYDDMRLELMSGQYLDLLAGCIHHMSLGDSLRVARLKSGNYTICQPLRLGAIAGGASPTLVAELGELGRPLGEAFQIQDDILGVFGRTESTGKPVGEDVRQGKLTTLITAAIERCDDTDRTRLQSILGDPTTSGGLLEVAIGIIQQSGALEIALTAMTDRLAEVAQRLEVLPVDETVKYALAETFSRTIGHQIDNLEQQNSPGGLRLLGRRSKERR